MKDSAFWATFRRATRVSWDEAFADVDWYDLYNKPEQLEFQF